MEVSLLLMYRLVQAAALAFLAAWIVLRGKKKAGSICRSFCLFLSIAALVLLYLNSLEEITVPVMIYLGISAAVFLVFALDKLLAVIGKIRVRVPENVLVVLSLFGVIGGLAGMVVFHHKNKKAKLQYTVPVFAGAEFLVYYILKFRDADLAALDWQSLNLFQWMTVITTAVLVFVLIRTYILFRVIVMAVISLEAAYHAIRLYYQLDTTLTVREMMQSQPLPFVIIAAVVFLILELIAVKSKYFTSGNEVRRKTDHSSQPEENRNEVK